MECKSNERMDKKKRDKFVRYGEGAEMYHIGTSAQHHGFRVSGSTSLKKIISGLYFYKKIL